MLALPCGNTHCPQNWSDTLRQFGDLFANPLANEGAYSCPDAEPNSAAHCIAGSHTKAHAKPHAGSHGTPDASTDPSVPGRHSPAAVRLPTAPQAFLPRSCHVLDEAW